MTLAAQPELVAMDDVDSARKVYARAARISRAYESRVCNDDLVVNEVLYKRRGRVGHCPILVGVTSVL